MKSKGFYEPSGNEILASAAVSLSITAIVIVAGLVLFLMGHWYVAWVPVPIGLLIGFAINVIFRGKDETRREGLVETKPSSDYHGGEWSKEA